MWMWILQPIPGRVQNFLKDLEKGKPYQSLWQVECITHLHCFRLACSKCPQSCISTLCSLPHNLFLLSYLSTLLSSTHAKHSYPLDTTVLTNCQLFFTISFSLTHTHTHTPHCFSIVSKILVFQTCFWYGSILLWRQFPLLILCSCCPRIIRNAKQEIKPYT